MSLTLACRPCCSIHRRRVKLGRVDLPLAEGLEQVAARHEHGRGAEPRHDQAAQPENAHAQALDVVLGLDLLGEPAAGFSAAEGARNDVHLQSRVIVHLLIELLAVAGLEPIEIALSVGAEGEAGEERRGWELRRPKARRGEAGIDAATRHLVEDLVQVWCRLPAASGRAARAPPERSLSSLARLARRLAEARQMRAIDDGRDEASSGRASAARAARPEAASVASMARLVACITPSLPPVALRYDPTISDFLSRAADATSWLPSPATTCKARPAP